MKEPWFLIEYIAHSPGLSEVGVIIRGMRYKYKADSAVVHRFKDMYYSRNRCGYALGYLKEFSVSVHRMNKLS